MVDASCCHSWREFCIIQSDSAQMKSNPNFDTIFTASWKVGARWVTGIPFDNTPQIAVVSLRCFVFPQQWLGVKYFEFPTKPKLCRR
jgi:hypothetical protein